MVSNNAPVQYSHQGGGTRYSSARARNRPHITGELIGRDFTLAGSDNHLYITRCRIT
jgi:hypothetical protein